MTGNLPGQSVALCGQPIQVAAWGSHSAGMRRSLIGQKPVLNAAVRVRAPVAQERPVAPDLIDATHVDLGEDVLFLLAGFGHDDAERVAHERVTPEFDSGALPAEPLEPHAIHGGDPAAVGDRVTALDRFPRVEL